MSIVTARGEQEQKHGNIFTVYCACCLTFNVIQGDRGLLFREFNLVIFFFRFQFFSIRPTDPISGNAFDAKRKNRGGG